MSKNVFLFHNSECPKSNTTAGQEDDSTVKEFLNSPNCQNEFQACCLEMSSASFTEMDEYVLRSQQLEIKPSFPKEKNLYGEEEKCPLSDENVKQDGDFHVVPCFGSMTTETIVDEHAGNLSDEENAGCQIEKDQSVPLWEREE